MKSSNVRVLLVCTRDWYGAARLPAALARVGFEVVTVSFPSALVLTTRHVSERLLLPTHAPDSALIQALARAIERASADWVIPGDDPAVELLHALFRSSTSEGGAHVQRVLQRSLGEPTHFAEVQSRRALHRTAQSLGVRVPEHETVSELGQALAFARRVGLPIVLKTENSCAGFGTWICETEDAIKNAFARLVGKSDGAALRAGVTAERFIDGRVAMRLVMSAEGAVLGGLSALKLRTHPAPTGPSTVVEFTEHAEMAESAAKLTRAWGLSGFASFDFMVEHQSADAYLIELNPRPTPICHLGGRFGDDVCGAFYTRATGVAPAQQLSRHPGSTVALFPQEWIRDPASSDISGSYHDVPWDDPLLVQALCTNGVAEQAWSHLGHEEQRREGLRRIAER